MKKKNIKKYKISNHIFHKVCVTKSKQKECIKEENELVKGTKGNHFFSISAALWL